MSGRPLITWAIDIAARSGEFDEIIVTTDDDEIASIARASGATVPFVRPPELADDHATTGAVMAHAVNWLDEQGYDAVDVCCIYPGAIFVSPSELSRSRTLLRVIPEQDFVMGVVHYPHPVQRALRLDETGIPEPVQPQFVRTRTQDLEPLVHDAGQFYWGTSAAWMADRPVHGNARAYLLPEHAVVDIDSEDDWIRAQGLHEILVRQTRS